MKTTKEMKLHMLLLTMLFTCIFTMSSAAVRAEAAAVPALSQKQATLLVNKKLTLKVKNTKKRVRWNSSNKKVATVKNGKVTGRNKGTAIITANAGKKKLTCKVKVVKQYSMNTAYTHLSRYLKKHYKKWKYVTFKQEATQTGGNYCFLIRYQGGNTPNTLAGMVTVNPRTGRAVFESAYGAGKTRWKIF